MFKLLVFVALFAAVMGQGPPDRPPTPGGPPGSRVVRQAPPVPGNPMQNVGPGNSGLDNFPHPDPKEWMEKGQQMAQDVMKQFVPGRKRRNV